MTDKHMTYEEHKEAVEMLRPRGNHIAIVTTNAYHLRRVQDDLKRRGIADRYMVICPGIQLVGQRFEDVYISGETLHEMERGSPATRQWFHEVVLSRLTQDANVITLP